MKLPQELRSVKVKSDQCMNAPLDKYLLFRRNPSLLHVLRKPSLGVKERVTSDPPVPEQTAVVPALGAILEKDSDESCTATVESPAPLWLVDGQKGNHAGRTNDCLVRPPVLACWWLDKGIVGRL